MRKGGGDRLQCVLGKKDPIKKTGQSDNSPLVEPARFQIMNVRDLCKTKHHRVKKNSEISEGVGVTRLVASLSQM